MVYVRPNGKADLHFNVRPDFAEAFKEWCAYQGRSMERIFIEKMARSMKRSGYWPQETAEEQRERRIHAVARIKAKEADEKKRRGGSRKSVPKPSAGKPNLPKGPKPKPNPAGISKPNAAGMTMGQRRRSAGRYTP